MVVSQILRKGLQANLATTDIDDCVLRFTTDTLRMYIEDGETRREITNVIYKMTEEEITEADTWLPKFYIARDTMKVFVSDGFTLADVTNEFIPSAIPNTETQVYYPVLKSADGVTNNKGYTTSFGFNPSTKELNIGDLRITQTVDEDGNKTLDFYIE